MQYYYADHLVGGCEAGHPEKFQSYEAAAPHCGTLSVDSIPHNVTAVSLQRTACQNSRNIFLLESEAGLSLGRTWDRFYSQAPHFHHNLYWSRAARGELTFPDKLVSLSLVTHRPIRYARSIGAVAGWCWWVPWYI